MKKVSAVVAVLVTLPIRAFITYSLLLLAHVDRLVWFLFWVYVPVSLLFALIDAAVDAQEKAKAKG